MTKIYTKAGDKGKTSLFGGERVDKNSARIRAYGDIDELNSQIGVVLSEIYDYSSSDPPAGGESRRGGSRLARTITEEYEFVKPKLLRIQNELFVLGTDLATPSEVKVKVKVPRVKKSFVTRLEKEIDDWQKKLPEIRNFILPGGSEVGARLHLARAIARRAERAIVELSNVESINNNVKVYINRLSDWLFVLARHMNKLDNEAETIWKGRPNK